MKRIHLQQHDRADCAAACLAMVSYAHGRAVSVTKMRDEMGTDVRGTTLRGLLHAAGRLGFDARPVRVDGPSMATGFAVPAIAQVLNTSGETHFVVVHRVGRAHVLISDPGHPSPERLPLATFLDRFTGVLVVLAPLPEFSHSDDRHKLTTLSRFVALLKPQWPLFLWAVVASLVLTVLGIASALVTKVLFDEVIPYSLDQLLVPVLVVFLVVAVVQNLVQFLRQWIILHLSQRIDLPLVLGYFRHVYSLPMSFFASRAVGDVLTRFGDALTIKNVLIGAALTVVMDLVMAGATGVVLYLMAPPLFALILVFVVVSIVLVLVFRVPFRKVNQRQMEQASILNSRIIEGLRGVEGIKLDAGEAREMEGLEREYVRSLKISFREGMLENGQSTLASLVQAVVSLVLLIVGANMILSQDLTLGTLMSFVALSAFFIDPVTRLIGLQLGWQEAALALRRIGEILDQAPEGASSGHVLESGGDESALSFENVSFRYGFRAPALDQVSFTVQRGSRVAFVGPSGSGKTTILKLLLRMQRPDEGRVLVRGVDVRELDASALRRSIAYVPQVSQLFSRSVIDNVRISDPDATPSRIRSALQAAAAHEFVTRLPQGSGTVLEEAGAGLSGGERRRIALARALLKDVDLYAFDEVTNDLDALTEAEVVRGILEHAGEATVVFVAHRLAAIANCDRIFVLDGGRLVEDGSHEQLVALGGVYATMWEAQNSRIVVAPPSVQAQREHHRDDSPVNDSTLRY